MNKTSIRCYSMSTDDKTFSAEVSTLECNGLETGLRSFITIVTDYNTEATFQYFLTVRDADNDVTHWVYKPTADSLAANPRLEGWSLIVFND